MTLELQPPTGPVADVATKLMSEFSERFSAAAVDDIVKGAHRDLTGEVPDAAMAELLYRLARQRLGGPRAG